MNITTETQQYIAQHRDDNVKDLALRPVPHGVDRVFALQQIEGYQRAKVKLPLWASTPDILFPVRLSMEQCSGEETARYKGTLVEHLLDKDSRHLMADITAGFGVDFTFLSQTFERAIYVERNEALCEIARHNLPKLSPHCHVTVVQGDGVEYLRTLPHVNLLFLDPARRDVNGAKVVAISDCEPDLTQLEDTLIEQADVVMVKLSPMLDIRLVMQQLHHIREVHIVAAGGECKELLLILNKEKDAPITFHAINGSQQFAFTRDEESNAPVTYAEAPEQYLYEPNAAVMKSGAYKLLSARYGVKKLHADSHLYTSEHPVETFPGRAFAIESYSGFGKKEMKSLLAGVSKANLTVRNFPISVAELRKKLKLSEGGEVYLFATTQYEKKHILIRTRKIF
jgi:16S rRNA G966 N2-methylase RsmD